MKKVLVITVTLLTLLGLLTACASKPNEVVTAPETTQTPAAPAETPDAPTTPATPDAAEALLTGLGVVATAGSSKDAGQEDGLAQADVLMAAVLVDRTGVIVDCKIDGVQAKIVFGADGKLRTPANTEIATKNELGTDYGMGKASPIGKEWNQQAEAFAQYVVGKTAQEVGAIAMTDGKAADADLSSSVTIHIGDFLAVVQKAVANAQDLGAMAGDTLKLAAVTSLSSSKDAGVEDGLAQSDTTMTAATFRQDVISSCVIDAVQVNVGFSTSGMLTTDTAAQIPTKNERGADYGMAKASSIGKEWDQQAAAFAQYVTGKTVAEVSGIAVTEGKVTDADLASSVTVWIGAFQAILEKAAG